jgi:hypothetical protein
MAKNRTTINETTQRIIATLYFALVFASGQDWANRANLGLLLFADDKDPSAARFLRAIADEAKDLLDVDDARAELTEKSA